MLRTLQTQSLSNKIATLFDTLVSKTEVASQPAQGTQPQLCFSGPSELMQRRRRLRRNRMETAGPAIKSAWF